MNQTVTLVRVAKKKIFLPIIFICTVLSGAESTDTNGLSDPCLDTLLRYLERQELTTLNLTERLILYNKRGQCKKHMSREKAPGNTEKFRSSLTFSSSIKTSSLFDNTIPLNIYYIDNAILDTSRIAFNASGSYVLPIQFQWRFHNRTALETTFEKVSFTAEGIASSDQYLSGSMSLSLLSFSFLYFPQFMQLRFINNWYSFQTGIAPYVKVGLDFYLDTQWKITISTQDTRYIEHARYHNSMGYHIGAGYNLIFQRKHYQLIISAFLADISYRYTRIPGKDLTISEGETEYRLSKFWDGAEILEINQWNISFLKLGISLLF